MDLMFDEKSVLNIQILDSYSLWLYEAWTERAAAVILFDTRFLSIGKFCLLFAIYMCYATYACVIENEWSGGSGFYTILLFGHFMIFGVSLVGVLK